MLNPTSTPLQVPYRPTFSNTLSHLPPIILTLTLETCRLQIQAPNGQTLGFHLSSGPFFLGHPCAQCLPIELSCSFRLGFRFRTPSRRTISHIAMCQALLLEMEFSATDKHFCLPGVSIEWKSSENTVNRQSQQMSGIRA